MFDVATVFVFRYEEKYTGQAGDDVPPEEAINEKKKEYEEIAETFLNEVFGFEDQLTREEWQKKVLATQEWVFSTKGIREKLEYA